MIGVAARALRPGKPSARGSSRRYGAVRPLAAHRDDIAGPSLFELERPDSRSRVRGGPGEAIARLERRRERLLRELDSVDAALEEASAPPESFPSEGDWGAELAPDYSYLAKSAGRYTDDLPSGPPMNFLKLGVANFRRELRELIATVRGMPTEAQEDDYKAGEVSYELGEALHEQQGGATRLPSEIDMVAAARAELRARLKSLTLSNAAVWAREESREQVRSPLVLKLPYLALCVLIDVLFENRPLDRFWFLENVARMPYLSYVAMLHLYESLGWWRRGAGVRAIHFAEEWNEMHHLLIMESLGGDQAWSTRFAAQHASIAYFIALCLLWLLSPTLAYNFSELIEAHAVDSYDQLLDENAATLKSIPPPPIAVSYYMGEDLYKYDEFQTERPAGSRRPRLENLYDVFEAISGDEAEHVKTMAACQLKGQLEAAADAEAVIAKTALGAYVLDLALRTLAFTEEIPEALEGVANFARVYSESGAAEALADLLAALSALLGL